MNIHNAIAISAIHGIDAFIIFSNGKSVTFCAAYRQTPTGGVIRPKESVITRNTTKNNGETPTACTAGRRIGTRIKIAAVASINIPTQIKNAYKINIITILLLDIPVIIFATALGRPSNSNSHDAGFAAIATNRIVPVERAFLQIILGISFHLRSL